MTIVAPLSLQTSRAPAWIAFCAAAIGVLVVSVCAGAWSDEGWKTTGTDRVNRYEGFIAETVANPEWELLSFTAARPTIPAGSILRVAFYLPTRLADSKSSIVVVGRELEDRVHYRMESKPKVWTEGAWNVFEPWKTSDVIDQREGVRDNLGVVVYPQRSLSTTTDVLPALVLFSGGSTDVSVGSYHLEMRSSRTAASFLWRLDRIDGATVVPVSERRLPGDFVREEPIKFDLAPPASEGLYRLTVCATPRLKLPEYAGTAGTLCQKDDIGRSYTFHHMPTGKIGPSSAR